MAFTSKAAEIVGKNAAEKFDIHIFSECWELQKQGVSTSPIEHLFYTAFLALLEIHSWIFPNNQAWDITISPQEHIGKYYVDFALQLMNYEKEKCEKEIVVELDGHNFHDKDERQRRYEKQRDRYIQSQGFTIFHFTGKEVTDDPFKPASEVFVELLGDRLDETEKDGIYPSEWTD